MVVKMSRSNDGVQHDGGVTNAASTTSTTSTTSEPLIRADVMPGGGVRLTEYQSEGRFRTETFSYYLTSDIATALRTHAELCGSHGSAFAHVEPRLRA